MRTILLEFHGLGKYSMELEAGEIEELTHVARIGQYRTDRRPMCHARGWRHGVPDDDPGSKGPGKSMASDLLSEVMAGPWVNEIA